MRKRLEGHKVWKKSASILKCWTSLLAAFTCLKKAVFSLLSALGSNYIKGKLPNMKSFTSTENLCIQKLASEQIHT